MRFVFTLARDLHYHTIEELGEEMSSAEFTQWQAFYMVDAWIQEQLAKGNPPSQAVEYARAMDRILTRTGK